MKAAVKAGYLGSDPVGGKSRETTFERFSEQLCCEGNLFSFNPALKAEGKNPKSKNNFHNKEIQRVFACQKLVSKRSLRAFLNNETRYSALTRKFPERAKVLFDRNEQAAKARFEHLQKLIELYK